MSRLSTAQPLVFGVKTGEGSQLHPRAPPPRLRGARRRRGRCGPARAPAGGGGGSWGRARRGSGQVRGWTLGYWGEAVARGRAPYLSRFPGSGGAGRPRRVLHPGRKGTTGLFPGRAGRAFVLLPRRAPRRLSSQAGGAFPQPPAPISQRGLGAPWTRGPGEAGSPVVRTRTGPALTSTGAPSAAPSPSPGPAASGPPLSGPRLPDSPTRAQRRGLVHPCSEFRERRPVPSRGPRPPRYPSQRRPSRACPGVDAGGPALRGLQRDPGRRP